MFDLDSGLNWQGLIKVMCKCVLRIKTAVTTCSIELGSFGYSIIGSLDIMRSDMDSRRAGRLER